MPHTSGSVMAKWYLKDSPRPESRGRTHREMLKEHKGVWNYEATTTVRIGLDKQKVLKPAELVVEVYWEHIGSSRINIGRVPLNMSEYVDRDYEPYLYLLHESKVNCTLTLQLKLTHLKGTSDYTVPEFTAPQVYNDLSNVLDEKRVKDLGVGTEMQKRLCQATSIEWDPRPGHMCAAKTIEDIFKGGNGMGADLSKSVKSVEFPRPWHNLLSETEERESFQSWKVRDPLV